MVRRWTASGATLIVASASALPALAQSLPLEEQKPSEPAPAASPPPPAIAPKPAPVVTLPAPLSTPVAYPEGGQGVASVLLELTLSPEGAVTHVIALEGEPLFAASAERAAKSWTFQPATRDGKAIAAKIRYLVRFVPPANDEPEPSTDATPSSTQTTSNGVPRTERAAQPSYEIVVQGSRAPIRHELGRAEIHDMPGAFGDPYRAVEALPGVVPIVSGLPYFYVRGAPPGNVGYLFDGIPVPFLYHFAAGPGVLHPAFVERVDLYPGAYPARYGRFAGAIVAGELAPPSYQLRGEASVRIIDSGAMVEAPFAGGRGSVMLGGRYSYTALVLSLIVPEVTVSYWDYQQRTRYQLGPKDSVELVAFGSGDFVSNTETYSLPSEAAQPDTYRQAKRENTLVDVGFHRIDLRLDHQVPNGNWRNALMLGRDRTGLDNDSLDLTNYLVGARSELEQRHGKNVTFRAGADVLFESLSQSFDEDRNQDTIRDSEPSEGQPMPGLAPSGGGRDGQEDDPDFGLDRARVDFTAGVWTDVVWDVAPKVRVTPGVRMDLFVSGARAALGVDPRISVEYELSEKLKLVHGLGLVHQAPSFVIPVPGLKPSLAGGLQRAVQYSAGASYQLPAGLSASFAVFQSAFFNMTDLISLVQLENTNDKEVIDYRTSGQAYGAELMIRRSLAKDLGGLVSYTLSRSVRFARRLRGPAATDRTHVLNVALSYNLGREWRLGGRFLLYSGIPSRVAYLEAAQSPPRTPPFWRIDVKLQKRWYIQRPQAWWGLAIEVLNTTLNKEQLDGSCNAFSCKFEEIGPVTIPSVGVEGAF